MDTDLRFLITGTRLSTHMVERLWTSLFKGLSLFNINYALNIDFLCKHALILSLLICKSHIWHFIVYIETFYRILSVYKLVAKIYIKVFKGVSNSRLLPYRNMNSPSDLGMFQFYVWWSIVTLLLYNSYFIIKNVFFLEFHDGHA